MSEWDEVIDRYESEVLDYFGWIRDTMGQWYAKTYFDDVFAELWFIIFGDDWTEHLDREHYAAWVRRLHRTMWTHMHRLTWWGDLLPSDPTECPPRKDLPAHHAKYWQVYDINPDRKGCE